MSKYPLPTNKVLTSLKITSDTDVVSDNNIAALKVNGGTIINKNLVVKKAIVVGFDSEKLTSTIPPDAGTIMFDISTSKFIGFNGTSWIVLG